MCGQSAARAVRNRNKATPSASSPAPLARATVLRKLPTLLQAQSPGCREQGEALVPSLTHAHSELAATVGEHGSVACSQRLQRPLTGDDRTAHDPAEGAYEPQTPPPPPRVHCFTVPFAKRRWGALIREPTNNCKGGLSVLANRTVRILTMLLAGLFAGVAAGSQIVQVTVRSAAPSAIRGGAIPLEVQARVAPGWHIHGHEADEPFLIPTTLTLEVPPGVEAGPIRYPEAEPRSFTFAPNKVFRVYQGTVRMSADLAVPGEFSGAEVTVVARLKYQACTDTTCAPPQTATGQLVLPVADRSEMGLGIREQERVSSPFIPGPDFAPWLAERGRFITLIFTFLLGLGLNLTPCVYPLISVTLAYFGRQSQANTWRQVLLASAYVSGIVVTFASLGLAAAYTGGMFGSWLQQPWVLVALAGLMVALAASSFGLYTIRLPRWLTNWVGGSTPGALGALLMGASMGVIAAPCVGPVVAGLLVFVGQQANPSLGVQLFVALGLGLGSPYLLLAVAASSLGKLPRSGAWLIWVERLLGFVLLALAVYLLAPLLPRRLVPLAYATVAVAASVVLGFLQRSPSPGFRVFQRGAGLAGLALATWLLLPAAGGGTIEWDTLSEAALEQAHREGKPVLIDFVADWCIPCHEMEATTFADRRVAALAQRFTMLRADVTLEDERTKAITQRFDIKGVPTIVLLDSRGREVHRMVGYIVAEELALAMERVVAQSAGDTSHRPQNSIVKPSVSSLSTSSTITRART